MEVNQRKRDHNATSDSIESAKLQMKKPIYFFRTFIFGVISLSFAHMDGVCMGKYVRGFESVRKPTTNEPRHVIFTSEMIKARKNFLVRLKLVCEAFANARLINFMTFKPAKLHA